MDAAFDTFDPPIRSVGLKMVAWHEVAWHGRCGTALHGSGCVFLQSCHAAPPSSCGTHRIAAVRQCSRPVAPVPGPCLVSTVSLRLPHAGGTPWQTLSCPSSLSWAGSTSWVPRGCQLVGQALHQSCEAGWQGCRALLCWQLEQASTQVAAAELWSPGKRAFIKRRLNVVISKHAEQRME